MSNNIYLDKNMPTQERVNNLISLMTLEEKIGQYFLAHKNEDEQWLRKVKPGAIINAIKKNVLIIYKKY